jgi:hypothetical protein
MDLSETQFDYKIPEQSQSSLEITSQQQCHREHVMIEQGSRAAAASKFQCPHQFQKSQIRRITM